MIFGYLLGLHILFYLFTAYTFWTFIFINIFINSYYNLEQFIIEHKLEKSNNIFIQYVINSTKNKDKNGIINYIDTMLSYLSYYTMIKEFISKVGMNFSEIIIISGNLLVAQIMKTVMTMIKGNNVATPAPPMNMMMSMLPMLLGSSRAPTYKPQTTNNDSMTAILNYNREYVNKEKNEQKNSLLYDSDDDDEIIMSDNKRIDDVDVKQNVPMISDTDTSSDNDQTLNDMLPDDKNNDSILDDALESMD